MWTRKKKKNRRLEQSHVLDVKMRSDKVRSARLRVVFLVFLVVAILAGVSFGTWRGGEWFLTRFIYENKTFAVTQIDIQTDGVLAPEQIRRWAMVKTGENLLGLDLAKVKRDLELVPAIESASLERILPRTLKIRIVEREPVAQIFTTGRRRDGEIETLIYHIDARGVIMPPLHQSFRSAPAAVSEDQLPLITGVPASEVRAGRALATSQMQAALQLVGEFETSPMSGVVELKRIDLGTPDLLYLYTAQEQEVILSPVQLQNQLNRWRLVHDVYQNGGKTVMHLDLSISNHVPVRWLDAAPVLPTAVKPAKTNRYKKKNV